MEKSTAGTKKRNTNILTIADVYLLLRVTATMKKIIKQRKALKKDEQGEKLKQA